MEKYNYSEEEFREAVLRSYSIAGVCRALGILPKGGNYRVIHRLINKYNTDTSHFTGQLWSKGKTLTKSKYHRFNTNLEDILNEGLPYQSSKLKDRLIKEGYKEYKCECCGNTMWNNRLIPLELHHINGNHEDNHLENLQLLCPNCHALTDNFRGSNQKRAKNNKEKEFDNEKFIPYTKEEYLEYRKQKKRKSNSKKVRNKTPKEPKICPVCGKEFYARHDQKYCSRKCYQQDNKGNRPTLVQLVNDFKELKSFVQVGNKYGVSDNAVRKWCILYGIPETIAELKTFLEECIFS